MNKKSSPLITFPLGLVWGAAIGLSCGQYFVDALALAVLVVAILVTVTLLIANVAGVYPPPQPIKKPRKRKGASTRSNKTT